MVSASAAQPGTQQPPRAGRGEKSEKNEKQEKHEKNEKGEKGGSGGFLGAVVGGLILIWLGVTFFFQQNGYLPSDVWWAYFLSGIGVILILQGVVIYSRGHRGLGSMIGGAVLLLIGMSAIATTQFSFPTTLWPLFLVAVGVFVLFAGITSRRRVPAP